MGVIPNAKLPDDWPLNMRRLIGEIVISAGQLEHILDLSYKRLSDKSYSEGMQEASEMFRCKLKTKKILDAAKTRPISERDLEVLETILRKVDAAWESRNDVIHAVYAEEPSGKRVRRRWVSKGKEEFKSIDLGVAEKQFQKVVDSLRKHRDELNRFTSNYIADSNG